MSHAGGTVSIRLFAGLESRTRERRAAYELEPEEAATLGAVLEAIGLDPGAAGLTLVNGVHAGSERPLVAGDEVALFPPLGGG